MLLKRGYRITLLVAALTAAGQPAHIDGAVTWEAPPNADGAANPITFTPFTDTAGSVDPLRIWVNVPADATAGQFVARARADADLGPGVDEFVGDLDVTIPDEDIATFVIAPEGHAEPIPA